MSRKLQSHPINPTAQETMEVGESLSKTSKVQSKGSGSLGVVGISRGAKRKKLSAEQAYRIRDWARGLIEQGRSQDALEYLKERKLGLWELPETHCFPLPKRRFNNANYVTLGSVAALGSATPLPSSVLGQGTIGGAGVSGPSEYGNGYRSNPPSRNFQSVEKTPPYDPSLEPSFKDRPEGTYERGEASPVVREQRGWVAESGIEELAGFLGPKPRVPEAAPGEPQDLSEMTVVMDVAEPGGEKTPAGGLEGRNSQENGVAEAAEALGELVAESEKLGLYSSLAPLPQGDLSRYAFEITPQFWERPTYLSWPPECEVEIMGPVPNKHLVAVKVVGGEKLPDEGNCSMWKQGRAWVPGARVRARLESPSGTIVYEPLD